jgi:hypothetical protein
MAFASNAFAHPILWTACSPLQLSSLSSLLLSHSSSTPEPLDESGGDELTCAPSINDCRSAETLSPTCSIEADVPGTVARPVLRSGVLIACSVPGQIRRVHQIQQGGIMGSRGWLLCFVDHRDGLPNDAPTGSFLKQLQAVCHTFSVTAYSGRRRLIASTVIAPEPRNSHPIAPQPNGQL